MRSDIKPALSLEVSERNAYTSALVRMRTGPEPLATETGSRLIGFAELVATAISNAFTRSELNASRARIVAAADESRRRIERDLYDGAQQSLVSIALQLRDVTGDATADPDDLRRALTLASQNVTAALDELRETARGIHPTCPRAGWRRPFERSHAAPRFRSNSRSRPQSSPTASCSDRCAAAYVPSSTANAATYQRLVHAPDVSRPR